MISPPSTVNVLSHEEDQFPVPGTRTYSIKLPHIRCYECDEYGHIVMIVHT